MSSQEQQQMTGEKVLETRYYIDPESLLETELNTSYNLCPRDPYKKLAVYSTGLLICRSSIWDARPELGPEMRLHWGSKGSIQVTGLEKHSSTALFMSGLDDHT